MSKTYSEVMASRAADAEVRDLTKRLCRVECACCGEMVAAVCESGSCAVCLADGIGHGNEVTEWSVCEESVRMNFPEVSAATLAKCKSAFLSYPWTIDA